MLLLTVTSWLDRQEREILAYLIEENRVLRRQLGGRRLRLTDDDRRRLAARAYRLGRRRCARSRRSSRRTRCSGGTGSSSRGNGPTRRTARVVAACLPKSANWWADGGGESDLGLHADPRCAENVGHRVGRSTIARILGRTASRPCRSVRHRGRRFCGRTGVRSPVRISSRPKSGRGGAW